MSGISFKIAAPPRPSSAAASVPPSRPGSSASTSRRGAGASSGPSHRNHRGSPASDDSDDGEGGSGRNGQHGGRERKRPRLGDEEVVEFGRDGAKSKHQSAPTGPLVIPALPNKDWRLAAEELRAGRNGGPLRKKREMYLPEGSATGVMSMSAGQRARDETPVGNVERMNDEEVVGGLEQPAPRRAQREAAAAEAERAPTTGEDAAEPARTTAAPESEEQRALRELLGGQPGAGAEEKELEAIESAPDARGGPLDEGAAFKRDLDSRPDEASLDDYARVPVGQFGLAMLRGMGWQPGQAASRSGRTGPVEAHVPSSRPALLGIGAKPMAEELGDGSGGKGGKGGKPPRRDKREDMRFVPLMKQAREGSASGSGRSTPLPLPSTSAHNGSTSSSRRASRSPPPPSRSGRSSRYPSRSPPPSSSRRDRERDEHRDRDRYRERERGGSRRDDRERDRERDERRSSRRDDDRRERHYERERDRDRERDRNQHRSSRGENDRRGGGRPGEDRRRD